jgi:Lipid A 3-O-deacylase (PagL)
LQPNRDWLNVLSPDRLMSFQTYNLRLGFLSGLIAVCSLATQFAHAQEAVSQPETQPPAITDALVPRALEEPYSPAQTVSAPELDLSPEMDPAITAKPMAGTLSQPSAAAVAEPGKGNWFKRPGESEIIVEGLVSYGNYKIFASGYDEKLFTAGVEYDRHSWGYFLKAQMDYVAEFLPFVLLDKPLHTDVFGNPIPVSQKNIREFAPGIGISPIGFRLQWRSKKAIRPYLEAKGGLLVFTKKVPSSQATYENFSLQSATGVQVKMNDRWGLRLGVFSDFHFSDDFIVAVNPGLDVMNANLGLSYHF